MEDRERLFHAKLVSTYNQVVRYEDPLLQDLYLAHVPVDELQQRAEELQQAKLEAEKKEMSSEDCFLLVLLKWFRCKFKYYQNFFPRYQFDLHVCGRNVTYSYHDCYFAVFVLRYWQMWKNYSPKWR